MSAKNWNKTRAEKKETKFKLKTRKNERRKINQIKLSERFKSKSSSYESWIKM